LSSSSSLPTTTLANGTTLVLRVGTAKVTASLSLSSVFYILKFSFTLLYITYTILALFGDLPDHCVFQEIGTQRTIGTRHEYRGLYHVETGASSVVYINSTSLRDLHSRFEHPTL